MSSSFVLVSENTGGLNNEVSSSLTPWDILRVPSQTNKKITYQIKILKNRYTHTLTKDTHLVNVPNAEDGDWLLTKEKSLLILNLELIVFPLTVNTVVLEHVRLQQ